MVVFKMWGKAVAGSVVGLETNERVSSFAVSRVVDNVAYGLLNYGESGELPGRLCLVEGDELGERAILELN